MLNFETIQCNTKISLLNHKIKKSMVSTDTMCSKIFRNELVVCSVISGIGASIPVG